MTEPLWKRNQQLETRIKELELEIVRLKNEAYITKHGRQAKSSTLMTNTNDIAKLTIEGIEWHNYNHTFKHKDGVITSYDIPIATFDSKDNNLVMIDGNHVRTSLRRQREIQDSFIQFFS